MRNTSYTCDRCGRTFDHVSHEKGSYILKRSHGQYKETVTNELLFHGTREKTRESFDRIDLCPDCQKELNEWLNNYISKEDKENADGCYVYCSGTE